MKQLATLLLCLFLGSTLTSATPYYPNGIPNIGPLKGEITFWGGEGENEEHFDGTGYEAKYDIKLPTKEVVKITISAEITNYQKSGTKSTHSFSIQNNIKEFTGEFNLCILNPNEEVIKKWLTTFCRRFFQQQFKRSCLPDGPKVGSVSLSPRGDWRMPSDASAAMWLKECEEL